MRGGGECVGDTVPLFGARDGQGFGHQRPPNNDITPNNQPKTGSQDGGEYEGEARQTGGAGEARYHHFGEALQLNGG
jgi:hypothetical protein